MPNYPNPPLIEKPTFQGVPRAPLLLSKGGLLDDQSDVQSRGRSAGGSGNRVGGPSGMSHLTIRLDGYIELVIMFKSRC